MSDDIDLEEQVDELKSANRKLERAIAEKDTQLAQFRLVRDALSAKKYQNQYIDEFRTIVENHYKPFTRGETSLPNEADMYEKLRQVETDLERMLNFSTFHTKTIAAIAGGFSSGKSTFINSFFTEKTVRLATGVKPSTVIPSYVVCEKNAKITGYNSQGSPFEIQPDLYESLTHESMQKIDFDLRAIIPYITVSCPMNKEYFEHICLIDTPGYNAPSIGSAEKDRETASAAVANANFLVWLIGLDQTGTIQQSDLDFLKQDAMPFGKGGKEGRDLYIVLNNKSGGRIRSDLEKIVVSCEQHLEAAGLSYTGLCAFDPRDSGRELYICRKMDFFDFLTSKNKPNANLDFIYDPLRDVLDSYLFYIRRDRALATARKNILGKLKIDVDKYLDLIFSGFENQMNLGSIQKLLRRLKTDVDEYIKVSHPETIESNFAELTQRLNTAAIQKALRQLHAGTYDSDKTYLEVIETGFDELAKQSGAVSVFEKNLKLLETLRKKFDACFAGVSRHLGITTWKPLPPVLRKNYCGTCGTKLETFHKFCPKCGASTILEEAK